MVFWPHFLFSCQPACEQNNDSENSEPDKVKFSAFSINFGIMLASFFEFLFVNFKIFFFKRKNHNLDKIEQIRWFFYDIQGSGWEPLMILISYFNLYPYCKWKKRNDKRDMDHKIETM